MIQTREKWNSLALSRADFCMVESGHGIPCFYFIFYFFLFRSNDKKEHLDQNNFRHGYGNYFKSAVLKVTWYQQCSAIFKYLSQQLQSTLTTAFQRYFTDFTDMDQHTC